MRCTDGHLVKAAFLSLVGIVVTQTLGRTDLASGLFLMTFGITGGLWLLRASGKLSRCSLLGLVIVLLSCLSVAINALLTHTAVHFSYLRKLIMFGATILSLSAMADFRPGKSDVRFLFQWNGLLSCFLLGMYLLRRPQMHLLNGQITQYLTFRFTNPNLAAGFLSAIGILELLHTVLLPKGMPRRLHLGLAGCMLFFAGKTQARNALLILAMFLWMYLKYRCVPGWKPRGTKLLAGFGAVFPGVFALGYLWLVETPAVRRVFSFLTGEGKGLNSRVQIWRFALEQFAASPVFGAYSQISAGTGMSQMHNSHLDILASYGLPVFLLVCLFLYRILQKAADAGCGKRHFLCLWGLLCLLQSGVGEAMLFSGGMGIYLFAGILLALCNYPFDGEGGGL